MTEPRPPRTEVSAAEVLTAVRRYVDATDGVIELRYGVYAEVGKLAGLADGLANQSGYASRRAWNTFTGQAKRAFDRLAQLGALRKAGAGTTGPDGQLVRRNQTRYYTPEAWDTREKLAEVRAGQSRAEADRWAALFDRLSSHGTVSTQQRGRPVRLSLADWERLADLADAGSAAFEMPSL